jgi:hexokinase
MSRLRYRPEILADIPDERIQFLTQYEDWFTVEIRELKKITDHFVNELEKGLSKEGGNIVSSGGFLLLMRCLGKH